MNAVMYLVSEVAAERLATRLFKDGFTISPTLSNEKFGLAPVMTGFMGFGGYFAYRFARGFLEFASEVGAIAFKWLVARFS